MKFLQSIILAGAVSALTLPTFAMDDDGDPSKNDPFYRAAAGKMHKDKSEHADAMNSDGSKQMMHNKSGKHYRHPVFSPQHVLTPVNDNR